MKFIKKLIKEEKIKLTEPSKNICESYLDKSEKSLKSAKVLIDIDNFDDAIALTYYSMYYSSLGILFLCGIKSENHTGTIILLKEIFDIDNHEIKNAKKERVDKQYYVDFHATKKDVQDGIEIAEQFNALLRSKIDKLKQFEIKKYYEKAKILIKN